MIPPLSMLPIVDAMMRDTFALPPTALTGASAVVQSSTDGASCA